LRGATHRLQSMSIALLVEKPCIMYGGRSVQWLALSAQLPRTSGHGRLRVAWQLGGSIVRHRLSFHLAKPQHRDKNLRHNEWKRVGISISPSHKFINISPELHHRPRWSGWRRRRRRRRRVRRKRAGAGWVCHIAAAAALLPLLARRRRTAPRLWLARSAELGRPGDRVGVAVKL
jgi:hypothetical protein